jgi:hypothetical protein
MGADRKTAEIEWKDPQLPAKPAQQAVQLHDQQSNLQKHLGRECIIGGCHPTQQTVCHGQSLELLNISTKSPSPQQAAAVWNSRMTGIPDQSSTQAAAAAAAAVRQCLCQVADHHITFMKANSLRAARRDRYNQL